VRDQLVEFGDFGPWNSQPRAGDILALAGVGAVEKLNLNPHAGLLWVYRKYPNPLGWGVITESVRPFRADPKTVGIRWRH
jgi:hypothetical protein